MIDSLFIYNRLMKSMPLDLERVFINLRFQYMFIIRNIKEKKNICYNKCITKCYHKTKSINFTFYGERNKQQ